MSVKQKLLNSLSTHPRLVTFGIGLAITFAIGTAIGLVDVHHAAAAVGTNTNNGGNAGR